MRNRHLHDALRAFALEAAACFATTRPPVRSWSSTSTRATGARARALPLPPADRQVHRRPLEPAALPALGRRGVRGAGPGASAYLRLNGLRGPRAEPALRALLERLYDELSDFAFPEERFERLYAEVEGTLYEKSQTATVLVPVHGLEMQGERVELGDGLSLVRGDRTDAPDEAVWGDGDAGRSRARPADAGARRGARRPAAAGGRPRCASAGLLTACACSSPAGSRWRRWHGGAPATAAGPRSSSRPPAPPAASRGSWSRARRPSCASSWTRSTASRAAGRWPGRCRASRWAPAAGWRPRP